MQSLGIDEEELYERYRHRTPISESLHSKALQVTPGGVMAGIKLFEPYPLFMKNARGSRIWDVDGNEYLDYLMSYGAVVLGHGSPVVTESISRTIQSFGTTVTGTPTELEADYAGLLRDIYHPGGKARFTNSGLESTLLAVRLAKGYTRRRRVAKFEGHYHGAVEDLLVSYSPDLSVVGDPERPNPIADSSEVDRKSQSDSLVLPFNNWEATERLLAESQRDVSCVVMEPFEEGVIPGSKGFMSNLRRLTSDLKIPLIFDEVKTGFRVRVGGAGEYFGIVPDLTCLGKIIGGGLPIGAVIGSEEIMSLLDPTLGPQERVFHSGTFNGNPLSLSAGRAVVEEIMKQGVFVSLAERNVSLRDRMRSLFEEQGFHATFLGEGGMFNFYLGVDKVDCYRDVMASDLKTRRLIDFALLISGIYLKPLGRFCISLAHSTEDVERTLERVADAFALLVAS